MSRKLPDIFIPIDIAVSALQDQPAPPCGKLISSHPIRKPEKRGDAVSPDELRELVEEAGKYKDDGGFRVSRTDMRDALRQAADEIEFARRVVEAARAWATECREDLGHDKMNLTWLVQQLAAYDLAIGKDGEEG